MDHNKVTRAFLFLDIVGYTKLSEDGLRFFIDDCLPQINDLVDAAGVEHKNSWGDAVFLVSSLPSVLAELAVEIRDLFSKFQKPELKCRIGLHVGEVLIAHNPIREKNDLFGANVNLAARIEPITPSGHVWVTKAFMVLCEQEGRGFAFDPVGERELAKGFGEQPLFCLRRTSDRKYGYPTPKTQVVVIDGFGSSVTE